MITRMQTYVKRIVAALVLVMLLTTLSGCDELVDFLEYAIESESGGAPSGGDSGGDAGDAIQVYFTTPRYPDDPSYHEGGIDAQLVESLDQAQERVDVAAYELDLDSVAEAMVRAHERGVNVRLVTDSDYIEEDAAQLVLEAGIPVVEDERDPFMHDKFVVIDGHEVWMGSWNLTNNCTYRNNNNALRIESTKLAENYTQEFEELFAGKFGATSPDDTPYPHLTVEGVKLENYFAAEGDLPAPIIAVLEEAETSIYFMAFAFTDEAIADVLIARQKAGVAVHGVMESRNAEGTGSEFAALERAGVDILADGNPYVMHHKVFIVDEQVVVTGSFNFTASAADKNDENVLIIHSPDIAARYVEEFKRVYQQAAEAE